MQVCNLYIVAIHNVNDVLHNVIRLYTTFLMTVSKAQRKGRAGQGEAGRTRLDQGGAGWEVRCSSALTAREVTES